MVCSYSLPSNSSLASASPFVQSSWPMRSETPIDHTSPALGGCRKFLAMMVLRQVRQLSLGMHFILEEKVTYLLLLMIFAPYRFTAIK